MTQVTYYVSMRASRAFVVLLLLFATTAVASAQTFQAQLTGEVRDSTGVVVPKVNLTATNLAANIAITTESAVPRTGRQLTSQQLGMAIRGANTSRQFQFALKVAF